jgi:hypothetical protein
VCAAYIFSARRGDLARKNMHGVNGGGGVNTFSQPCVQCVPVQERCVCVCVCVCVVCVVCDWSVLRKKMWVAGASVCVVTLIKLDLSINYTTHTHACQQHTVFFFLTQTFNVSTGSSRNGDTKQLKVSCFSVR